MRRRTHTTTQPLTTELGWTLGQETWSLAIVACIHQPTLSSTSHHDINRSRDSRDTSPEPQQAAVIDVEFNNDGVAPGSLLLFSSQSSVIVTCHGQQTRAIHQRSRTTDKKSHAMQWGTVSVSCSNIHCSDCSIQPCRC